MTTDMYAPEAARVNGMWEHPNGSSPPAALIACPGLGRGSHQAGGPLPEAGVCDGSHNHEPWPQEITGGHDPIRGRGHINVMGVVMGTLNVKRKLAPLTVGVLHSCSH